MRIMRFCGLLVLLAGACAAQAPPPAAKEDISGMYSFLQDGEFVQVNVEGDLVTGFVSRYSDGEQVMFLDHFFKNASLKGNELSFGTKPVHGVWFEFKGRVERGGGATRADEEYHVIKGRLTQFTTDANKKVSAKARDVRFRSFPDELWQPPAAEKK